MQPPRFRRAFTLIELASGIAIVAILLALLLPSLSRMRAGAAAAVCQGNLRQLASVMSLYANDNDRRYPLPADDRDGKYITWYQSLINGGYLESPKILSCPGGHYGSVSGTHVSYSMTDLPLWNPPSHRTGDFPDFFTKKLNNLSVWPLLMDGEMPRIFSLDDPQDTSPTRERFSARHNGRANVLMADGHIELVSYGDTRWSQRNLNTKSYYSP